MTRAAVAAIIAAAGLLGACQSHTAQAPEPMGIAIFANEDLSGPPIVEPIATLTVTYSAGTVCYANDLTGQDQTQYYTDCAIALKAGAHILPAN